MTVPGEALSRSPILPPRGETARRALRLVVLLGVVSLFADTTYEGARSVAGPFLQVLGANAFAIGVVVGVGELASYALRPVSGRLTDRSKRPWLVAFPGYFLNLLVVPALALAGSWPVAALLFVLERVGKGLRNPPRDTILSHAGRSLGEGWAFGLHEALDQTGAVLGPVVILVVLATGGGFREGFAYLLVPAVAALLLLALARRAYPTPSDLEPAGTAWTTVGFDRLQGLLVGAGLLAGGVVGFPLVAYFLVTRGALLPSLVPALYAVGMASEGASAWVLGHLSDRIGERTLVIGSLGAAASAPLLFTASPILAVIGMGLWGVGMGAQTSVLNAAVTRSVPPERRAGAFGRVQAVMGLAALGGGIAFGALLDQNVGIVVLLAVGLGLAASAAFAIWTSRAPARQRRRTQEPPAAAA